jgi:hypothetical protein
MLQVNEKLEIKEIEETLRWIQIEIYKTNELLQLLWEFLHENPVISIAFILNNMQVNESQLDSMVDSRPMEENK